MKNRPLQLLAAAALASMLCASGAQAERVKDLA